MVVKHLMKGVEFMVKNIRVLLLLEQDQDFIRFFINNENGEYMDIDLNSNNQSNLRLLYQNLIRLTLEHKLDLNLEIQEHYNNYLFKEIAIEFIKDLQFEIDKVRLDTTIEDMKLILK